MEEKKIHNLNASYVTEIQAFNIVEFIGSTEEHFHAFLSAFDPEGNGHL